MIKLILILVIINVVYSKSSDYDYICKQNKEDLKATNGCIEWPFCKYAHPTYCDEYIQCDGHGKAHEWKCTSKNHEWDEMTQKCDERLPDSECAMKRRELIGKQEILRG